MFDLLIRGGTVIDGTGRPGLRAEVGVRGDRITLVGQADAAPATATIDAAGLVVAPGIIDVHTHSDGWLLKQPYLVPKLSQGITTEVLMSDGISYAPVNEHNYRDWFVYLRALNGLTLADYQGWRTIADYMRLLDRRAAQNTLALVPYANVRVAAAGWGRAAPDDTQMRLMLREIERSLADGAAGLSTGLDYVTQCFDGTDTLVEACRPLRSAGGLYVTHVRYKKGTLRGVQEAVEIGRRAGCKVHISHLKGTSPRELEELLDYIDRVAVNEVDFTFDVYPYLAASTMAHYLLPYEIWEDGPLDVTRRLRDPQLRLRAAELLTGFGAPPSDIRLAWAPSVASQSLRGVSLADYAECCKLPVAEALCNLVIEEHLAVLAVVRLSPDELIEPMLAHEKFMLGSDGIDAPDGHVHPRMFGSATRVLGPLVRERKLFTLEAAVRKLTSYPAERFGLKDRGIVREGALADLVVFDPQTVGDRATYDSPRQLSVGIEHVIVNGRPVWRQGETVAQGGELPGRALRFAQ